jgi:hypothetical protein
MKVFVAVMMDRDGMANHNNPDTLVAATHEELEQKMRDYMLQCSWHVNMPNRKKSLTKKKILTMPLDDLEEAFLGRCSDEGYGWAIEEHDI